MKIFQTRYISILLLVLVPVVCLLGQVPDEIAEFTYGGKLYEDGLFDLALMQYQRFVDRFPESAKAPEALFRIGECFLETGQYTEARKEYFQLLIRFDESPFAVRAQSRIAESYSKAGDLRKAAEAYYRVFAYYPESDSANQSLYRAALLYNDIGMTGKSEAYAKSLLNAATGTEMQSSATLLLLDIYFRQGRWSECETLASSLISSPLREGDAIKAEFILGGVYEQQADWESARALYERIITAHGKSSADGVKASLRLARVQLLLNMPDAAVVLLTDLSGNAQEPASRAEASLLLGNIRYAENNFADAAAHYHRAAAMANRTRIGDEASWRYFRALLGMHQPAVAAAGLDSLLSDSLYTQDLVPGVLLFSARAHREAGAYDQAVNRLNRYISSYPGDALLPRLLICKAAVIMQSGDLSDEAGAALRRVISDYRGREEALEARFRYGEVLAATGRDKEAIHLFTGLQKSVPWTIWGERAGKKIEEVSYSTAATFSQSLLRLSTLMQEFAASSESRTLLNELGVLCFDSMGRYRDAIRYHRAYLAQADSGSRAETSLYQIAESYRRLYNRSGDRELADSAASTFQAVVDRFPDGPHAAEAGLAELLITGRDDISGYLDLYTRYRNTPAEAGIIFNLGRAFEKADSLARARELYTVVSSRFPGDTHAEIALYRNVLLSFSAGLVSAGDSLSSQLLMRYPHSKYLPEIYSLKAETVRKEDPATAINILEALQEKYPFSEVEQKASRMLAGLYLETEKYTKAVKICRTSLRQDSLETIAAAAGLIPAHHSRRSVFLRRLGAAWKGLGNYTRAADAYLRLLRSGPDLSVRTDSYLRLAEIERLMGRDEGTEHYLSLVPDEAVTDSMAAERGLVRMRIGRYADAARDFELAKSLAESDSLDAIYSAKYITVLYLQHQFTNADARFASFSKTFRQLPEFGKLYGEISIGKAKVYAEQKRFDNAIETLRETLKRDIGDAEPAARLELGKDYLKTNQIEEALPLLTAMPAQYPGHPVLAEVYLNLGDHYQNSKQYTNATFAYRKATEIANEPEISRVAYNRLMNSQAGQALFDGAMATARQYLERFPNAPDVMNYREKIGDFYTELHDYRRAIEVYRDLKPYADPQTETSLQYKLGQCYDAMGLFQEAVFEYLKVAYLSKPTNTLPWKATALYNAGQAYQKLDEPEKARRMYEMIIEREGPGSHFGKFALERIEEIDGQSTGGSQHP